MAPFLLLAAYVAGILIGDNASPFSSLSLIVPAALLLLWVIFRHRVRIAFSLICAISLCLGIALYDLNRYPQVTATHLFNFAESDAVIIDGRILATTARALSGYSIDVQSARIIASGGEIETQGRLRLYVENGENLWNPGDDIRFSTKLKKPRPFGTPGEFDLGRQLALNEIFVTGFVPNSAEILRLRPALPGQRSWVEQGRTATARFITAELPSSYSPLVKALAIGDKSGLDPKLRDLLARGGVSHLFAISGLHLALVGLALYAVGLTLYRRSTRLLLAAPPARILPLLIAPLLILYLLWTGIGVSTQRALLMVLVGSALFLLRRKTEPMNILCFAALVLLLCQPLLLFTPSFQLSFAALAGILCGSRHWAPLVTERSKIVQYLAALLFSSLAATLATLPLVIYHFHLVAPSGIITNLFAIPVISWVAVPLALAGSLLWPVTPEFALILLSGCEAVIAALLQIVALLLTVPGLSGWMLYPSFALLATISLLTVALFLPSGKSSLRRGLIAVAFLPLLWGMRPLPDLTVTAISVGQGEALLVSLGSSHYLIDGGGLYGDRLDTGRQLVAPALGRLGVHRLDGIILTHSHPDHAKGLLSILTDIPAQRLIVGTPLAVDDPLLPVLRDRRIPLEVTPPGWTYYLNNNDLQLALFRPTVTDSKDENDQSLAIYVRSKNQGALLTGDLAEKGIQNLLANPPSGPVTLFKLPHHGSQRSVPAPLIDLLQPRIAFASAGYKNRFGFPNQSVVTYLEDKGIPLFRTDFDGTFRFSASTDSWQVKKLQSGFFIDNSVATLLQNSSLFTHERSRPE
ncbi:MAG: DNA internalization-related competence protein ComEC/Rec2 [Desulfuromonadales bacterium]|nr:DNA internalization-related competence protein ComEC/Rec2 [Desulfuromonadales bacterium]